MGDGGRGQVRWVGEGGRWSGVEGVCIKGEDGMRYAPVTGVQKGARPIARS